MGQELPDHPPLPGVLRSSAAGFSDFVAGFFADVNVPSATTSYQPIGTWSLPLTSTARKTIFAYTNMTTKVASRVDVMFRAFSDRTRLRILHMLRGGELCVCHIVDVLGVPQPKASRHLAYLRKAGLVRTRKEGRWSYYKLAPARNKLHQKLINCLSYCCKDMPELLKDDERLGRQRQCCD